VIPHILVDPDGAWLDPTLSLSAVVTADPALLAQAAKALPGRGESAWLAARLDAEARAVAELDTLLNAEPAPSEPRTVRDLAALASHGSVLVFASSMPVRDLDTCMAHRRGLRVLANRGVSGIDGFVSTAVGVAGGTGQRSPVTCPSATTRTACWSKHDRPDLVLVVLNNDGGIFSLLPQARFPDQFGRVFGTPHGVDLARLAAVYECGHRLLAYAEELPAAVADARTAGGLQLIEVRTDRAENAALHRRLLHAVARTITEASVGSTDGDV
jgi:2-succinyl-5-enolpyruvyl-6-hydroxy-3-cyclohexene-1-carboxylate synthase